MNRKVRFIIILWCVLSLLSCREAIDNYDKAPDWLKGNAYELLSSKKNFTIFLKAAEFTGYKPLLNGAGLCTVFAPDDDAFSDWLEKNSFSSIEDAYRADPEKLKTLIGYHLVEQSFSATMLLDFQMKQGPGTTPTEVGLCHKYKTYSKDPPYEMYDPVSRKNVMVYNREKYLPVISTRLFNTKAVENYKDEYTKFFPEVNWKGDSDKLYVGNASMTEVGLPTDNGYVYVLDKVVDPLRTLYQALPEPKTAGVNFSAFFKMMNRFASLTYDKTISDKFAAPGEKYYLLYHNAAPRSREKGVDLPELASEWAYHGQEDAARPSYNRYLSDCYNCFAFTDEAFEAFAQEYLPIEFRNNIDDIPDITLYYLLLAHAYDQQQIVLPSEIYRKGVIGQMGEEWRIQPENMIYTEFCANGILYGLNTVYIPTVFEIITKPLFTSPDYTIVANMFRISNQFVTIIDREPKRYTLFLQSDELLMDRYALRVNYKNPEFGDEVVEYRKADGGMATYNSNQHVQTHIIDGYIEDFTGPAYYRTRQPFNYVFVRNDSIYGEDMSGYVRTLSEGVESVNGITYEIDGVFELSNQSLTQVLAGPAYIDFVNKMEEVGLVEREGNKLKMDMLLSGERYMVFVPADTSLAHAPTDSAALVDYLRYHFVPMNVNQRSDYVLPGLDGHKIETLYSYRIDHDLSSPIKNVYVPIKIDNLGTGAESLKLINPKTSEEVFTEKVVPRFATDGVVYKLTGGFTIE